MPNNSRKDHGHIFMKEFDANEIEMINEFFNKCSYLEKEIQTSLSYINIAMEEKSRITQQKLLELADKH